MDPEDKLRLRIHMTEMFHEVEAQRRACCSDDDTPMPPCMRQDAIGNAKKAAKQPTPSVSELRRGISFHDGAEPLTTTSVTSSKSAKELAWQDVSWSRASDCLASM